ncbi:MAG: glycosyltransferase family 4 protein [Terriglobia bacterium]|jgi:glycosyltransferase involved in cell wall biosynthesis
MSDANYRPAAVDYEPKIEYPQPSVALLTGGSDRPYAYGLSTSLVSKGIALDFIGSDDLDFPEFRHQPQVSFFNLHGDLRPGASFAKKLSRLLACYGGLIHYAATAKPRIFHILWNNRLEWIDRTLLLLYYRSLGKRIVLTAHNVNQARRDHSDTRLNRATLRIQYRLADHIFVHTEKMKLELIEDFGVSPDRITVIPFGINNSVPDTGLTPAEAKRRLGLQNGKKALLFYGRIRPSKGLEYLVSAFREHLTGADDYQLIIAGRPDKCEEYWAAIRKTIQEDVQRGRIVLRAEIIPDDETEAYFKAADVLVLPYREIFQSGVIFLGYNFSLPVLAADVGSLKDDIVEGKTGFVFRPEDPVSLARTIEKYFASDIYRELNSRRQEIRDYALERHSWGLVAQMTMSVYGGLLNRDADEGACIGGKAKVYPKSAAEEPR